MGPQAVALSAGVIAVAAAVRSAWSPCSLSMLSMLTPFGERGRGSRYPVAAAAFVVGAVLGGVCLGVVPAAAALLVDSANLGSGRTTTAVVVATLLTVGGDLGLLPMPRIPRQVNESWFGQYRAWVYGLGYGWQLGAGVTTYAMTTAVYLMVVLSALTGSPLMAVAVCAGFGAVRGVTVLLGVRLVSPEAIRVLHHRFDRAEPASRAVAILAQVAVISVGLATVAPVWLAASAGVVVVAAAMSTRAMPSGAASAS